MKIARALLSWIDSNEKLSDPEYHELITRHQKNTGMMSSVRANLTFQGANNSFAKINEDLEDSKEFANYQKQYKNNNLVNNTPAFKMPYPQQMPKMQNYNQVNSTGRNSFDFESPMIQNNLGYARNMLNYQQMNQEG